MHSVPVYISEMAPSRVRGMLVACKEALIVAGMLAGYTVSAIFIKQVDFFTVVKTAETARATWSAVHQ
jgi:hypothetical protein